MQDLINFLRPPKQILVNCVASTFKPGEVQITLIIPQRDIILKTNEKRSD